MGTEQIGELIGKLFGLLMLVAGGYYYGKRDGRKEVTGK